MKIVLFDYLILDKDITQFLNYQCCDNCGLVVQTSSKRYGLWASEWESIEGVS